MQARVCVGAADDFARAVDRLQHIKKEMQEGRIDRDDSDSSDNIIDVNSKENSSKALAEARM